MRAVDIIRAKRDGEALSREAIDSFVAGLADGSWQDYQASALLMAIVIRGMSAEETAWLTDAMVRYLTETDGIDHVALVATTESLDLKAEIGIGVAQTIVRKQHVVVVGELG